jgi:hypothetical protein
VLDCIDYCDIHDGLYDCGVYVVYDGLDDFYICGMLYCLGDCGVVVSVMNVMSVGL